MKNGSSDIISTGPAPSLQAERPPESRAKSSFLIVFSLIIMFGAALGFGGKIVEFLKTWHEEPDAKFAVIPVAIYFMTAIGFACFFVYATLNGMLSDVEGPKYRMLDDALEQDRLEADGAPDRGEGAENGD